MSFKLRDYQREAIDSVYDWFTASAGNPLVVVPTGGGKSVIAAEMIREICTRWPDERIMVVTHVKELIRQNYDTLLRCWPEAPAGIYSAGLRRRDTRSRILFAGVQSVFKRADELGHFDIVIVDEAHLVPPKGFGMYQQLLSGLRATSPKVKLIGLTATPYRTDTGRLDEGEGRLFDGVAFECDIIEMIKDGWLCEVTNKGVRAEIDTSAVHIRGGEFCADELEEAAMADGLVEDSVEELIARSVDRKSWLIFACGIAHATQICAELTKHGIINASVFGTTPRADRAARIDAFKRGAITALVNVGGLTTGFDAPGIDLLGLMRPTQSPGLYVQMTGRGLRTADGKADCLVLDFGTNVQRHGPLNAVRPRKPGERVGEPPMKVCGNPDCMALVYAATTICPECGYVFKSKDRKPSHAETPDEDAVLLWKNAGERIQKWEVSKVFYGRHRKPGKPDSLRVAYSSGLTREVSEWVCFEHGGYARIKAEEWWRARSPNPIPGDVTTALARSELGEILSAVSVTVDTEGQYPSVKGVLLEDADTFAWRADAEDWQAANPYGVSIGESGDIDYGEIPF